MGRSKELDMVQQRRAGRRLAAAAAILLLGGMTACSGNKSDNSASGEFDAEEFFRGRTISVVVNASAGGGIDSWTRLVMAKMSDVVPGKPRFAVTNQVGIGGLSTVYDAPPGDLVLGTASKGSRLYATQVDQAATHDIYKLQMVGGLGDDPRSIMVLGEPAKAFDSFLDARGKDGPPFRFSEVVGDASAIVEGSFAFSWLCETLDLPCIMTPVADGGATALMPMVERGELNVIDSNTPSIVRSYTEYLLDGRAEIFGEYSQSELTKITTPNIKRPNLLDILPDDAKKEYERILPVIGGGGLSANIFAGPNFPPEAIKVLSDAFLKLFEDEDFKRQVRVAKAGDNPELQYDLTPVGSEEARRLLIEQADRFFENENYYKELQQRYWEKYWS